MTTQTRRSRCRLADTAAGLLAIALLASDAGAHELKSAKADFIPPAPGTYRLERIQPVPEGAVLDTSSKPLRLSQYTRGRITLLSLIYTSCSDAAGCPMALYSLQQVRRDLEKRKSMHGRVRLVSLSFDPAHDTPEAMRAYGNSETSRRSAVPWYFLTTASPRDLRPILDGLGQDVRVPADAAAAAKAGNISHTVKVFLIDRDGWVREIYTSSFLVPQVIVNDVQTLLLEDGVKIH